jgi:hypothetical protein
MAQGGGTAIPDGFVERVVDHRKCSTHRRQDAGAVGEHKAAGQNTDCHIGLR